MELADAAPVAGPAAVISFVIAGVAALCSALSYAELAGSVPVSGSAYSYTYATLGELIAWVCGWCLLLEYGVSVAAVAVGWGAYLNEFFRGTIGVTIPDALAAPPGEGGIVNIPAALVVLLATAVLLMGVRESARATVITTLLKIAVLVFFVVVALTAFRSTTWRPSPPTDHRDLHRRLRGVLLVHRFRRRLHRREEARNRAATCRGRSSCRWPSSPPCTCWWRSRPPGRSAEGPRRLGRLLTALRLVTSSNGRRSCWRPAP